VKKALQMLDILLVFAPYLPVVQKAEVVDVAVSGGVLDGWWACGRCLSRRGEGSYDQGGSDGAFSGTFRLQEYATSCSFDERRI